ncbi:hypothetical protein HDU86_007103 [Geranomyces michiganensis]|nr:hypothetical protein HDU86_007103 [Geranomyces michiganensis]
MGLHLRRLSFDKYRAQIEDAPPSRPGMPVAAAASGDNYDGATAATATTAPADGPVSFT